MSPAKVPASVARPANPLRPFLAGLLAFLVPGLGHLYLRRRGQAAVFFATITALAIAGWLVNGEMYSFLRDNSGEGFLQTMAALGSIFLGAYHLIFHFFGLALGEITARSHEYGTTFILIAALLNILVILNAWDVARESAE